ncbi:DUF885 family protein [Sandarakinorhabdus sp.]|jgi:uncharacterized protein (DUF885 family)|uniref:DUF885 domain-containing protein n=1 Tax=Sandarakinorhabdus sp. TaxID=1916663 RepID=UPI0035616F6D
MTAPRISRRQLLAGTAAIAVAGPAAALTDPTAADAQLLSLFDAMFAEGIAEAPERATALGLDVGANAGLKSRLSDYSRTGRTADLVRAKSQLDRLRGIPSEALSPERRLDRDVVEYDLSRRVMNETRFGFGRAGGNFAPYVLTHSEGAYRDVPGFLESQHGVTSASDAEAWLARLSSFASALDQNTGRLQEEAAMGVILPAFLLDLALPQMSRLRATPAGETVLVAALARKAVAANVAGDWGSRAAAIVEQQVFPALDRQIAAVTALRKGATMDAGVWKLPDGAAYYDAAVKSSTTTNYNAEDVHQLGLAQVAEISSQLDALLKGQGLTQGTVGQRLVALNERPDQTHPNTDAGKEELLTELRAHVASMYPRLERLFITQPKSKLDVKRVPLAIQEGGAGAYYQNGTPDGARNGTFFINLTDSFDRPKFGLPTVTFHEGVPGHHFQVMLALESPDVPPIRRRAGYSAYTEGWALYAETLADENGYYEGNPLGRIGYLQSLLFRATRLVVDTGLHHKRWTKDQAIDWMVAATGFAKGRTTREIVRYAGAPGQALSYKIGHTKWLAVREAVKAKQGADFDIRQFHEILRLGAMPLVLLEREALRRS